MKGRVPDPLAFIAELWPHVRLYDKQKEIVYSVWYDDKTVVPAGNMLGKDYIGGLLAVCFFLTRHPCRIVTTSAKDDHLRVLWGEIGRFIDECKYPLRSSEGGPLICNHHDIRKIVKGKRCPLSYLRGMVAGPDSRAAMQGHHVANTGDGIPRTLALIDEASSTPDEYMELMQTWARRILVIGNPWPCSNFFYRDVEGTVGTEDKGGDMPRKYGNGYSRRVIHVSAWDSPNIKLAQAEIAAGKEPSGKVILEGVKDWDMLQVDLSRMDKVQKCVSIEGRFYKGSEVLMFPPEWLNLAERRAELLRGKKRRALAIGVDPAEGGDTSAFAVVDQYGLIDLISIKTPDTNVVPNTTLALMKKYNVDAENVVFDRGGGGKQHADLLRSKGYEVQTIAFGGKSTIEMRRSQAGFTERKDVSEDAYAYLNKRAEMYGDLMGLLDPGVERPDGQVAYAIPREFYQVRQQLGPIPKLFNGEGTLYLLPKNKRSANDKQPTLTDLIGHSPDEADAFVLAIHGWLHKPVRAEAGAF